jgi:hypothetical protein
MAKYNITTRQPLQFNLNGPAMESSPMDRASLSNRTSLDALPAGGRVSRAKAAVAQVACENPMKAFLLSTTPLPA